MKNLCCHLIAIIISILFFVSYSQAAETKTNQNISKAEPNKISVIKQRVDMILSRIEKNDPNEYTRLTKMRTEDPEKFQTELQKSMRQMIAREMPPEIAQRERTRRHEISQTIPMPKPPGREELIEKMYEPHLKWLGENYPAEAEKLKNIKQNDPNSYQEQLKVSFSKYRQIERASKDNPAFAEVLKNELKLNDLIQSKLSEVKSAKDAGEKQKLTGELKQLVEQQVDNDLKKKQSEHEQMMKRVAKMQEQVKANELNLVKEQDAAAKKNKVEEKMAELTDSLK